MFDLSDVVVWMASTCPPISKSSRPFTNPLGIVPSALTTIVITDIFIFYSFLVLSQIQVFISLFIFFYFHFVICRDGKVHYLAGSSFFGDEVSLGLVIWPRLGDPFVSHNPRELVHLILREGFCLCIYNLFVWPNFNFLLNSQCLLFPTDRFLSLFALNYSIIIIIIIIIFLLESFSNQCELMVFHWSLSDNKSH